MTQRETARGASEFSRQLLAGFLAGASAVLGVLLFLSVLLFVGALGPLLYDIASGLRGEIPFWSTIGQVFAQSFASLPRFLWNGRWAIVGFGLVGLLLSLVASQSRRIERPWRGMVSSVAALGLVGAIVFAYQYSNRETLLAWLAGQPYLFSAQNNFLLSNTASLAIGLMVALIASYVIWGMWNWWYARWSRWLRLEQAQAPAPEPVAAPADSSWQAEQARLHRSKRGLSDDAPAAPSISAAPPSQRLLWVLLALLAGTTLALLGALQFYNVSGSQLAGGDLFVSPASPEDRATVVFDRTPRQAFISSINGQGVVDVMLGREQAAEALRSAGGVRLTDIGTRGPPTVMDLAGLEAGRYWLNLTLRENSGGQVRYSVLQGGGTWAQVASVLVGIAAGIWLALAMLAILETLTARGWLKQETA
jgi:hypothetical protein